MVMRIYGRPTSRARRVLWIARMLGLDFENVPVTPEEMRQPAYLALNPNGKMPALRDGDVTLFESHAILLYLARKYGAGGPAALYPATVEDEARLWQWVLWATNEVDPLTTICLVERLVRQPPERDDAKADAAEVALAKPLGVLEGALQDRAWLIADRFTAADIAVASTLALARRSGIDLSPFPAVERWLDDCLSLEPQA